MGYLAGHGRYGRETYPTSGGNGGGGAAIVPLTRQRFIDGGTSQPGLTGSAAEPFKTIAQFVASRPNTSALDSQANYVGWVMPAINNYVENVSLPPYKSTELRADSSGAGITGNVTWNNVAGLNTPIAAICTLHNMSVSGVVTVTDDAGAPPSIFIISGDELGDASAIINEFVSNTTTKLGAVEFFNVSVNDIDTGTDIPARAAVVGVHTQFSGAISGSSFEAIDCILNVSTISVNAIGQASFIGCAFIPGSNPALTCLAGSLFDGPSWRSFLEAGGTRTAGTVVLVVGGYSGGEIRGADLTSASTSVSLNGGVGSDFTGSNSGNHYVSSSVTPTSVTLLTSGALPGDTILITRTSSEASNLAVKNSVGAVIATIPTGSRGFVLAQFDGGLSEWIFAEGGALAA
jgi:hypothetical protein